MKITGFLKEKSHLIFLKIFCLATSALLFILNPVNVLAQTFQEIKTGGFGLKNTATTVGFGTTQLQTTVAKIINSTLGLLGIIALVLIIYAGFLWMTAGGESEKTKKAKDILTASFIGLIIILASYALANFVVGSLVNAT